MEKTKQVPKNKIFDEFTDLPISSSYKAQLRAVKRGVCKKCYKRPHVLYGWCEQCQRKNLPKNWRELAARAASKKTELTPLAV